MAEERIKMEERCYDGVALLVGFVLANVLTALLGKLISVRTGIDPLAIVIIWISS